jgi:hypothetical protein
VWQQTLPPLAGTHDPLAHWALVVHEAPSGSSAQVVFPWQKPLAQSPAVAHPLPVPQVFPSGSHWGPPQSTSVSLPSRLPSLQETQVPGPEPKQKLLTQSLLTAQCSVSPHFGQGCAPL